MTRNPSFKKRFSNKSSGHSRKKINVDLCISVLLNQEPKATIEVIRLNEAAKELKGIQGMERI